MRQQRNSRFTLLIPGIIAIFLSYLKFGYCISENFSGLSATSHGCYSDIPIFWNTHLLEIHLWPYQITNIPEIQQVINPIEYPFLTGLFIWIFSFITPQPDNFGVNFFIVNSVFNSILFLLTLFVIYKIKPNNVKYFALAPAVFASLFINWDIFAVLTTLISIYFFDKNKRLYSSLFLAISISFKFYPIVLLFAVAIIGLKKKQFKQSFGFTVNTIIFFLIINIVPVLINFKGWFYFYQISSSRGVGSGSFWEFLNLNMIKITNLNLWAVGATVITFILMGIFLINSYCESNLASMSFLCVFSFILFNKVYSPQFVIWLASLAVLILREQRQIKAFIVWQFSELIFHFGVWRYLYWQGFGGKTSGVSDQMYKWLILFRILCLLLFVYTIIAKPKNMKLKR